MGVRGAVAQKVLDLLQLSWRTLGMDKHGAVRLVPDPARYTDAGSGVTGIVPESHALDPAVYAYLYSTLLRFRH